MAPGSKRSSISSNTDTRSRNIAATPTSEQHTLLPNTTSTTPSPSTRTSATCNSLSLFLRSNLSYFSKSYSQHCYFSWTFNVHCFLLFLFLNALIDESTARQRRVRGPTLGKRTRSLIASNGGEKLHVYVTQEMGALCGKYATKAANELGSHIRRMCPIAGFHHSWKLVPPGLKSAIFQAFRVRMYKFVKWSIIFML